MSIGKKRIRINNKRCVICKVVYLKWKRSNIENKIFEARTTRKAFTESVFNRDILLFNRRPEFNVGFFKTDISPVKYFLPFALRKS